MAVYAYGGGRVIHQLTRQKRLQNRKIVHTHGRITCNIGKWQAHTAESRATYPEKFHSFLAIPERKSDPHDGNPFTEV